MREPKTAATRVGALPQLAWQVSAIPAQLLGLHGAERKGLPFLVALSGTAVLGVVDWPVALLIAGGYLLSSRAPRRPPAAEHQALPAPAELGTSGHTKTGPAAGVPTVRPSAPAEPAPAQANAAGPDRDAPAAGPGQTLSTAAATRPKQPDQPASAPDQAPRHVSPAGATHPPQHPPGAGPARGQPPQKRLPRPARRSPSSAAPDEPWPGYDQMTVPRVVEHLDRPNVDLAAVERYEAAHRDRKMVRAAITSRRASR